MKGGLQAPTANAVKFDLSFKFYLHKTGSRYSTKRL